MILLDEERQRIRSTSDIPFSDDPRAAFHSLQLHANVGNLERAASIAAGALLLSLGLSRRSVPGMILAGAGVAIAVRGASGHCPLYQSLGIDTASDESTRDLDASQRRLVHHALHVEQALLINRSPEDLYDFWRNLENLPRIMTHLESVTVIDDRRSHWVAKAPIALGRRLEWDAQIITDQPGALIAWRSLPGADIDSAGSIHFEPAPGERGAAVRITIDYVPPAGRLGKWIATLFGDNPDIRLREELRNFKRIMETGEILTTQGQPRGTCTGRARRQSS